MKLTNIDGSKLKEMIVSSAQYLENNKQAVDALNVFPVPDGDTGTNMAMTILAASKEVRSVADNDIASIVGALSRGALKGARGNSGVILSQLFRGFAKALQNEHDTIDTVKYAQALQAGVDTAYKAVMKPVEGTILTVARLTAAEAVKVAKKEKNFLKFYRKIIDVAQATLDHTPDMLPVLKQAGVVDSGGMGLIYILKGTQLCLEGKFDLTTIKEEGVKQPVAQLENIETKNIKFGYCTEFFIKDLHPNITETHINELKDTLAQIGDSIVVASDTDFVKVHVHTNAPGKVLQMGLQLGELSTIKIDNMREQHRNIEDLMNNDSSDNIKSLPTTKVSQPEKQFGVIAVAIGEGISSIFKDLSVDYVLEGGQTMNPSIDQLLQGVDEINAKEIFILPNNSNIIMSAKQAKEMSDKVIHVIPSKSIPQGLAAMLAYDPDIDAQANVDRMTKAIGNVKTGLVTYAVRDSQINSLSISKGDIIGIFNSDIVVVDKDIQNTAKILLGKMLDEDSDIVTIYYGQDITENEGEKLSQFISSQYPDVDVECYFGGQPLYYYIISVE